jgi:hypothetical protein
MPEQHARELVLHELELPQRERARRAAVPAPCAADDVLDELADLLGVGSAARGGRLDAVGEHQHRRLRRSAGSAPGTRTPPGSERVAALARLLMK